MWYMEWLRLNSCHFWNGNKSFAFLKVEYYNLFEICCVASAILPNSGINEHVESSSLEKKAWIWDRIETWDSNVLMYTQFW